jgi:hypothetical protein
VLMLDRPGPYLTLGNCTKVVNFRFDEERVSLDPSSVCESPCPKRATLPRRRTRILWECVDPGEADWANNIGPSIWAPSASGLVSSLFAHWGG